MSKFCPLANAVTNCTDNCTACLREELKEKVEALEYITSDIDTMIDARKNEEETKCQNTQNLKPNTKKR